MTPRPLINITLALGATLIASIGSGCKKQSGPGSPGPSGSWLVGADGAMANLTADGTLGRGYSTGTDHDLLAITCRGANTAFVVGEGGTLLRTFDGGDTWETIDVGTTATLRDVGVAAGELVFVAGDQVLLVSRNSGDTWEALPTPPRAWRSLATSGHGSIALILDDSGGVWRWDDSVRQLHIATTLPGARAVTLSHEGDLAAVVGEAGLVARSDNSGVSWTTVATGTLTNLNAAWATETREIVGVGDAGVVVRIDGNDVEVTSLGTAALRAVHIDGNGIGLAAGDNGALVQSDDGGQTWQTMDLPFTSTIYGVDAVAGAGHL